MATILCLETATTNCSVAIAVDGEIKAIREENNQKYSHAEKLHVFIDEVLKEAKIDKKNLDAVAVSKGPGSYTGLRIGVSAAKGLCFAMDIPLISTLTLEVLAQQVQCEDCFIIPLLDARRMEVYSAVFNSEKKQIRETKAEILNENSFTDYLKNGKTIFIGDGAVKFEAICKNENAIFQNDAFPTSADMVLLAEAKYKISDTENVAYFEPFYLKEFILG
ncbi:tRNA (adenosine(37)-N6)-threonylcarbamoyltransferase complex dimerization subunit type 1 TsaB [Aequorivita antarctica]|uniref:tRNA (Adenosine(37)-N6)-threonylcarbamoyltransferase complex dimerization subunit type 1 TsaB n=1 Tax=Aequorivita antarctica TaxID=153266 RepID=A0A5C6Z6M4_9FLAO|nr:tRNA (adenosine(37)-N6)-threonylcarbamoyltransferase complex dimerization subunit type 1 TsaB [Aequorivita antarctica]TXD75094.1 tRNA (adenosine(37)-N6)-threonylcarbamoyltransferase complex dimerization subunit type 1 TsaB [Aequorivita antarctica]SRX72175.1 tRNA threonylcarbamoyladenosine biosynthesis protein TsaB [Aequorivita antarctica]